jgi:hypothetical protein
MQLLGKKVRLELKNMFCIAIGWFYHTLQTTDHEKIATPKTSIKQNLSQRLENTCAKRKQMSLLEVLGVGVGDWDVRSKLGKSGVGWGSQPRMTEGTEG